LKVPALGESAVMVFGKENTMVNIKNPISADELNIGTETWESIRFNENLINVVAIFASNPVLHCVFIVDPYDRLLGVITRHDLLNWISKKLATISFHSLSEADQCIRLRNLINATKVQEVMDRNGLNASIYPNDTLLHALNFMTEFELTVLPIIDESNRIIGARTLSEILFQTIS
jgi:CBS-domain-containing membrane protein